MIPILLILVGNVPTDVNLAQKQNAKAPSKLISNDEDNDDNGDVSNDDKYDNDDHDYRYQQYWQQSS